MTYRHETNGYKIKTHKTFQRVKKKRDFSGKISLILYNMSENVFLLRKPARHIKIIKYNNKKKRMPEINILLLVGYVNKSKTDTH